MNSKWPCTMLNHQRMNESTRVQKESLQNRRHLNLLGAQTTRARETSSVHQLTRNEYACKPGKQQHSHTPRNPREGTQVTIATCSTNARKSSDKNASSETTELQPCLRYRPRLALRLIANTYRRMALRPDPSSDASSRFDSVTLTLAHALKHQPHARIKLLLSSGV